MNFKTTLFFVLIIFAQYLNIVSSSRIKATTNLKASSYLELESATKMKVESESKVKVKVEESRKTCLATSINANQNPQVIKFLLKNPETLQSYTNLESLKVTLTNADGKLYTGEYDGTYMVFKDIPQESYEVEASSVQTIIYNDTITLDGSALYFTLYLVEYNNDNKWIVILTWTEGAGLFNSAEVGRGIWWSEGMSEQQKLLLNNYGPQITKFEIDKEQPRKDYAIYEVYYEPGFSNNHDTGAHVVVYNGRKVMGVYDLPQVPIEYEGNSDGKYWHVFEIIAHDDSHMYKEYNDITSDTSLPGWNKRN